jgi:hypothetical protein
MKTILEITAEEVIELLKSTGVLCEELWFQGSKWSYSSGFLEGESKWALRHHINVDDRYKNEDSLESFTDRWGRVCIPPHAALEYLACQGLLEEGECLVWKSW